MTLLRGWFAIPLWKRVLGVLALGIVLALVQPQAAPAVQFLGDLFVRAIRMLVVPIVLVTIASGMTALGDPKRIGGLGGRTVGLFAFTTALAVSVGMGVATLIRPRPGSPARPGGAPRARHAAHALRPADQHRPHQHLRRPCEGRHA